MISESNFGLGIKLFGTTVELQPPGSNGVLDFIFFLVTHSLYESRNGWPTDIAWWWV